MITNPFTSDFADLFSGNISFTTENPANEYISPITPPDLGSAAVDDGGDMLSKFAEIALDAAGLFGTFYFADKTASTNYTPGAGANQPDPAVSTSKNGWATVTGTSAGRAVAVIGLGVASLIGAVLLLRGMGGKKA
jgi:hypothetical protein